MCFFFRIPKLNQCIGTLDITVDQIAKGKVNQKESKFSPILKLFAQKPPCFYNINTWRSWNLHFFRYHCWIKPLEKANYLNSLTKNRLRLYLLLDHKNVKKKLFFPLKKQFWLATAKYDKYMSHVVGVLQISYLFSCAGSWLSQHCCVIATVIIYKSQWVYLG